MTNPFNKAKDPRSRTPFDPNPSEVLHRKDDVDVDEQAHHHTLGLKPTQAAAGNHSHADLLALIADLEARVTALEGP